MVGNAREEHLYVRTTDQLIVVKCHGKALQGAEDEPCLEEDGLATCPNCGWRMTVKRYGGKLKLLGLYR